MEKQIFRSFTIGKDHMIRLYKKNFNCLEMNHSSLARRLSRTEYHRTFELVGTAHLKYYQKTIRSLLLSEEIFYTFVEKLS